MNQAAPHSPIAFIGIQAALKAGRLLKNGFGTRFAVSSKANALDLVTEFDHVAETEILSIIRAQFPNHAFLAEESGRSLNTEAPVLWIIDPLDGTMNFVHQVPLFAVSIAAYIHGRVEFGAIYQPMSDELYTAQRGYGAYLNGTRLQVSAINDLHLAIGSTGFPYDRSQIRDSALAHLAKLMEIGNPMRMIGSAALALAYVAAGKMEAHWGLNLSPWDVAAGQLLIEESGGQVTHVDGSPYDMFKSKTILASNATLHQAFLAVLTHTQKEDEL